MPGAVDLGKLFGKGSPAEQLLVWNVIGQFLSAVMGPELELLARGVNEVLQATPLSPDQLADMVVKGHVSIGDASAYAKQSGISPSDFQRMVDDAGEAPGLEFLLQAFRRGIIPKSGEGAQVVSLEQGIREGHLTNKWIDTVEQMGLLPIGVADAVDAAVENQIPYAQAEQIAYVNGIDADNFRILYNTRGNPPSPGELATLLKRKLIPLEGVGPNAISFQQGIFEGASKDKWWELYAALADYVPPPRTIVTLVHDGVVTDDEALALFESAGLTTDLAEKYLKSAHLSKGAAHRATISGELRTVARRGYLDGQLTEAQFRDTLAQANVPADTIDNEIAAANLSKQLGRHTFSLSQIKKQRQAGLIDDATARQRLVVSGWSEDDAQTQINEWNAETQAGRSGLTESRILAYLVSGILTPTEAYDKLIAQGITTANATFLVQHPSAVPAVKTHGSSAATIIAAYKDGVLDLEATRQKLIATGMTADAADLELQVVHVQLNRGPKPKLAHKVLTEAQILEAFRLGFAADTWALRELTTLGYSDADASLLVAIEETKLTPKAPASWATLT